MGDDTVPALSADEAFPSFLNVGAPLDEDGQYSAYRLSLKAGPKAPAPLASPLEPPAAPAQRRGQDLMPPRSKSVW